MMMKDVVSCGVVVKSFVNKKVARRMLEETKEAMKGFAQQTKNYFITFL